MMRNESDERLVERFQTGERAAFDEIARRYRPRLLRFLRLRTRSLESAEDLTQETLMKAFESLDALRSACFFSGWLHRVAYRTFVDSTRRRRLEVVAFDENPVSDRSGDAGTNGVFATRTTPRRANGTEFAAASPEEAVALTDECENVWRVARKVLTSKEFKTLWSRYVDGASDDEIALALGVSSGAVRVSLTRARQKLIARLRTGDEQDGGGKPKKDEN
ncbi:MAG: RNA polymerase sigma factor [Thermoguttaceae bacterium]|nr:RNA polymerase sigma factor [Thermoguttaceae bacterium]